MKKLIYIVGGLAIFFVVSLCGLFLWFMAKSEFKKNSDQTAPARAARWAKKQEPETGTMATTEKPAQENLTLNPADEKKIDALLDQIIQEKKNENQS